MATIKVRWSVSELANVMSKFDEQKVYRSTTGINGTYSEITGPSTRVTLVAGTTAYYYDDTSGDSAYYYKISYYNSVSTLEAALSAAISAAGGGNYITVQDLRDAGFTETQASDSVLLDRITQAEAFIETQTGRWFYPKELQIKVDGTGSYILPIQIPIIEISEVRVLSAWAEYGTIYGTVTLENVRVANRHLTHGLTRPDDRDAPCLTFEAFEHVEPNTGRRVSTWWEGTQNVVIDGWFGHTELGPADPIGETSEGSQVPLSRGSTPVLIKRAAMLLVARWLPSPADQDAYYESLRDWSVEKYKTRDQEIVYNKQSLARGTITGDAEIDNLLSMYMEGAEMAFV
jgi:hypothetical protein